MTLKFGRSMTVAMLVLAVLTFVVPTYSQSTAFTYQGRLADAGVPASGPHDMTFRIFGVETGGSQVGSELILDDVSVINGIFTVTLDFGSSAFTAESARYLEILVRPGLSSGASTTLAPRQPLTKTPYSIKALNAGTANALSPSCTQCVTDGQIFSIDGGKVTGQVASASEAGVAGNVSGIVQIPNGGTGSATKNFVDLSTDQTIAGNKTFTGTITGNGSGLTQLAGSALAPASVTDDKVAFNTRLDLNRIATGRWHTAASAPRYVLNTLSGEAFRIVFDGRYLWTLSRGPNRLSRIDRTAGTIQSISTSITGTATDMAVVGNTVFVLSTNQVITRFDASAGTLLTSIATAVSNPTTLETDGTYLYVGGGSVERIFLEDTSIRSPLPGLGSAEKLICTGTDLYSIGSAGVVRLSLSPFDGGIYKIPGVTGTTGTFDGTYLYVGSGQTLFKLNGATGSVLFNTSLPSPITALQIDGTYLNVAADHLRQLRLNDLDYRITRPLPGSGTIHGIGFDGNSLYFAKGQNVYIY